MNSFKIAKIGVCSLLAVHLVLSVSFHFMRLEGEEVFPIFSWFLFWREPQGSRFFTVRIKRFGDREFPVPLDINQMDTLLPNTNRWMAAWLVQRMGIAQSEGEWDDRDALREVFDRFVLSAPASYELIEVRFERETRWKVKKVYQPLAEFTSAETTGRPK